jgi:hypothetical protein
MYDGHHVLHLVDRHAFPIVALCGIALLFNYAWYAELIRVAYRDKCYTMAPATTLVYLGHDGSYLIFVHKWWGQYHHWFTQLFWFALVLTFSGESVIFVQTLRYGRHELAPRLSQRRFVSLMLVAAVLTAGAWAAVKLTLGDDLYLVTFMALIFWAAPFGTAMLLRRPAGLGVSTWMWFAFTMIGVLYGAATILYFGAPFRTGAWIALFVGTCAWGGYNVWLARAGVRQRAVDAARDQADRRAVGQAANT